MMKMRMREPLLDLELTSTQPKSLLSSINPFLNVSSSSALPWNASQNKENLDKLSTT